MTIAYDTREELNYCRLLFCKTKSQNHKSIRVSELENYAASAGQSS